MLSHCGNFRLPTELLTGELRGCGNVMGFHYLRELLCRRTLIGGGRSTADVHVLTKITHLKTIIHPMNKLATMIDEPHGRGHGNLILTHSDHLADS